MVFGANRLINQFFLALASLAFRAFRTNLAYDMRQSIVFLHSRYFGYGRVEQRLLFGWSDLKIERGAFVCSVRESGLSVGHLTDAIESFQPQADESSRCAARRGRLCRLLFGYLLITF